jgi:hypothetical protein
VISFLKDLFRLSRKAKENVKAASTAEAAYDRSQTLPDVLRAFAGQTTTKGDDQIDEAVLAALGQIKQSAYNGSQILRGLIPLLEGLAVQCDEVYEFLDRAEREPLKDILEG